MLKLTPKPWESGRMWKRQGNLIRLGLWGCLAHVSANRFVQAANAWAVGYEAVPPGV